MKLAMPSAPAPGSVWAYRITWSANAPLVIQAFSPSSPPSAGTGVARVVIAAKSLPAPGSLSEGAPMIAPDIRPGRVARDLVRRAFPLHPGHVALHVGEGEGAGEALGRQRLRHQQLGPVAAPAAAALRG